MTLQTIIRFDGKLIRSTETSVERGTVAVDVSVVNEAVGEWKIKPWHPNHPNLYDVEMILKQNGKPVDTAYSYFGMRSIRIVGDQVILNHTPIYQRLAGPGLLERYAFDASIGGSALEDIDKTLAPRL